MTTRVPPLMLDLRIEFRILDLKRAAVLAARLYPLLQKGLSEGELLQLLAVVSRLSEYRFPR
jgi:hypothetical protein